MLNQLLKWSIAIGLWKKYGRALKWFPVVLLLLFVIYAVHRDYIEFVEVSQVSSHLALSFVLKWLAVFCVIAIYIFYIRSVLYVNRKKTRVRESLNKKAGPKKKSSNIEGAEPVTDPFERIRQKEKLRSKADVILTGRSNSDT